MLDSDLHWREYFSEALCLALFMVSAGSFGTLLEAPESPLRQAVESPLVRRALMGIAMGLTAACLIYAPFGKRSGAHMNPAVTLSFFFLGKVRRQDAIFYVVFQFLGALCGVLAVWSLLGGKFGMPPVNFVATRPGAFGTGAAFAAEFTISMLLFFSVLIFSNHSRLSRYTGIVAAVLVCVFITFEAPISGMSMNPARSFASAVPLGVFTSLWLYFTAPPLGMLAASAVYRMLRRNPVQCAKLIHTEKHRCIFCGFKALSLAVLLFVAPSPAAASTPASEVQGVEFNVRDLERSVAFYRDVLGFSLTVKEGATFMTLGEEQIRLKPFDPDCPTLLPNDGRANDLWFQHIAIVVSDMDRAYEVLRKHGVQHVSNHPQTIPAWNKAASGIRAFYFRDPDGHNLELIYFPKGRGLSRWQKTEGRLFLGIDHTAIAVSDTERSIAFYRDELGLTLQGSSENWGTEQEHLNNLFGAHVRITGLRNAQGMGIELLQFLSPPGGRETNREICEGDIFAVTSVVTASSETQSKQDPDRHFVRIRK